MSNPEVVTQRRTAASSIEKPAGAKNSVFDNGGTPKKKGWPQALPPLDLSKLVIKQGVPLPPKPTAAGGRNKALAEMTKAGDYWEMPAPHAKSFQTWGNKQDPKIKIDLRDLGNDMVGVWRS